MRRLADDRFRVVVLDERCVHPLENGQGLASFHDVLAEPHHRQRHARIVNPALHLIHEAQEPCIRVVDGYVDDLRIEDVAQLLANEVVDRLLLELARDRLLHTVDQREFGVRVEPTKGPSGSLLSTIRAVGGAGDLFLSSDSQALELARKEGLIAAALMSGKRVQITGFGTFETRKRKAREGRNPQTGERIKIAASRFPAFHAGKALKDRIKK